MHKSITFKFVYNSCPYDLNEIFEFALCCRVEVRKSFCKAKDASLFARITGSESFIVHWPLFVEQFTRAH